MIRWLAETAVRRRVTVVMFALAITAFGLVGYSRLSLDLLPDISYPSLTVRTEFPDTAPAEVENLVTRPIEEAVGVLRGLQSVHSISRAGVSEVTLEFDWGTNMDALSMDVREKIDRLELPIESENPVVLRFDPSLDPIFRVAVKGPASISQIRSVCDKRLKQEFETVHGVAAVEVKGGLEEEIQIDVAQGKLASLGIPIGDVRNALAVSNVNAPGGALRDVDSQYLIRTVNEYRSIDEIGGIVVAQRAGAGVTLEDVATVRRGHKEREEITRENGSECVELALFKEGDANSVRVADAIRAKIEEITKGDLPKGWSIEILFDQSRFIRQATNEVWNAGIQGGILATLVLFAFLRDVRSTLIIAVSIPLSVVATLLAMYKMGISLNIMSLGGLSLGIGMLVDNAIVIIEVIYRRLKAGESAIAASINGTSEVGSAVLASTLTSVAVFLPLVFVEGIAGQLFKDQALTVSFIQLISLLIAITLVPMLTSIRRRAKTAAGATAGAGSGARAAAGGPRFDSDDFTLGRFSRSYDRLLARALAAPRATLAISLALFLASLALVPIIGTELIPALAEGEFHFDVTMPEGTPLAATDRVLVSMEGIAAKEPAVERTFTTVGSRLLSGGSLTKSKDEGIGQLNIVMKDRSDEVGERAASERLRGGFASIPDLRVDLGRPSYFSLKTPVELILFGENMTALGQDSERLLEGMRAIPGLVDARSSLEAGNPEYQIMFNRPLIASYGLDVAALSNTIRDRVQGAVATRYKEEDRQIDVRVRNQEPDRDAATDIGSLVVAQIDGRPVTLSSVATVRLDRGPAEIHRIQQQRAAVLSGNLEGRTLGAVATDLAALARNTPLSRGETWELGGQNREMENSFKSLQFALLLAVFLVYLVMASTFESLIHPLIVLLAIPMALTGVLVGLFVTGQSISVVVFMGVILLAGIVVNNAIVLIDAINQMRQAGVEKGEAIRRSCHTRIRPILMTTLTAVLGLIPMALSFGEGAELRAPMAITVISGLMVSTLLTLVVIPVAYLVVPSRVALATDEVPAAARSAAITGVSDGPTEATAS